MSCNECGAVYNTVAHLMAHGKEKHWSKDNVETTSSNGDSSEAGSDEESSVDERENEEANAYEAIWDTATDMVRGMDEWEEKYNSHKTFNNTEEEAADLADADSKDDIRKAFRDLYAQHMLRQYWLKSNEQNLHAGIAAEVMELVEDRGMNIDKAVKRVIRSHMDDLEEHWDMDNDSDDENDDESD